MYTLPNPRKIIIHSFSLQIRKKKKEKYNNKLKNYNLFKPLFKSEEIENKIFRKSQGFNLSNRESLRDSVNLKFKTLKEREIKMKNSDIFLRDSKVRLKNPEIKNGIKLKIEKYQKLFNLIDRNNKGFLSLKNLNLSNINNDELEILTPVLSELQKKRKNMNFKEFCILIDRSLTSKIFNEN